MFKFAILIPSYNEYITLKKIIRKIYKNNSILIMNDNSNDGTSLIENKFKKVMICNNKSRIGYEKNLVKGFKILIHKKFSHIITFDADGEHHVTNINKVKKFILKKKNIDLLVGNRSFLNRFSEKIISILFKYRFGIKDPLTGLKVYKTSVLKKFVNKIEGNFFLIDLLYEFIKHNKNIKNFNIRSVKIKNRKSRIGNPLISNLKIFKCFKYLA